jgi:hypothetical protein
VSLAYDAPAEGPRYHMQRGAEPGRSALTVAEALRSRFPLRAEPARGVLTVADALRSRFPARARPALPRRRPGTPTPAPQAHQAASPELLRRILDGLQRL